MELRLDIDNGVIIIKPDGNLVASTAEKLKEQVAKMIEKNYPFILLDMGQVEFIDSSGLGACISINRDLAASNGLLVCTGLNDTVRKLFRITRADQKIMVLDSAHDGLKVLQERLPADHM
jgi:anti-sigma B factor antagonist